MRFNCQPKQIGCVFILSIICWLSLSSQSWALDKTSTGFYYPTGSATWPQTCGIWLGRDANNGGCYEPTGVYHIGQDMIISQASAIYAISDGDVVKIYTTDASDDYGLGTGNSVIFVKHTLKDGSQFLGVYMHVRPSVHEGDHVTGGSSIATVGPYQYSVPHLHFAIHPSLAVPTTNWGRMPNSAWGGDNNGFVDPINWLMTKSPPGSNDTDIYVGINGSDSNGGGTSTPFRTVRHAIDTANAIQSVTIHIAPGTYNEKVSTNKHIHFVTWGSGIVRIGG